MKRRRDPVELDNTDSENPITRDHLTFDSSQRSFGATTGRNCRPSGQYSVAEISSSPANDAPIPDRVRAWQYAASDSNLGDPTN